MDRFDTGIRERGFALISRWNRRLVAGAVGLAGVLSIVAAGASHAHQRGGAAPSSSVSAPAPQAPATSSSAASSAPALQAPGQPPAPVPAPAPTGGAVVSGGS